MKKLKIGDKNNQVLFLQKLLQKAGYILPSNGEFDSKTQIYLKDYQNKKSLSNDGIVGGKTWQSLLVNNYNFNLGCINYFLNQDEWHPEYVEKDTIYLHHTAGLHRPDYTIDWWESDNNPGKLNRIGTAFVIGREAIDGDKSFDGKLYRAFNEIFWASHLGTTFSNNTLLNQKSIGIEICSLGGLFYENKKFLYKSPTKNIEVPENQVCILETSFRGYQYFQKYTTNQIEQCKTLILTLSFLFDIPLSLKGVNNNFFDMNPEAIKGNPGLFTHTNVREDKSDCFPQPEFINMLNELSRLKETYFPVANGLENNSIILKQAKNIKSNEDYFYSLDL